jgi:nucleoside-diphosphate-sugar epimerase
MKSNWILVTGGAGFIGSHLAAELLQLGYSVRILDNLSTGKVENLEAATGCPLPKLPKTSEEGCQQILLGEKALFLFGSIADPATCQKACQGVDYVFHEAALGSVQRSVEDPLTSHRMNATGTLNVLQAAKEAGVKRLIYASSSSVYGNVPSDPEGEKPKYESLPPNPQSPYAATKLSGEIYCQIFSNLYQLETVSLRYFNVFGPRQDPNSIYAAVIPKFMHALANEVPPIIFGDGNQSRDFTFVGNVVQANLLAMTSPGISGQVFNIACGKRTSLNVLLGILQEKAGRRIHPKFEPLRKGEVRHSLAAIDRAARAFGYAATVDLRDGLAITWKWFQEKKI